MAMKIPMAPAPDDPESRRRHELRLLDFDEAAREGFAELDDTALKADLVRCNHVVSEFKAQHGRLREPIHRAIDKFRESAQKRASALLAATHEALRTDTAIDELSLLRAEFWLRVSKGDSPLIKGWHESVDKAEGFSKLKEADYRKKMAALQAEVDAREREVKARPLRRELALAQARVDQAAGR